MPRIVLFLAALLPLTTFATGKFTLQSPDIKPNEPVREAHVYKGFGCEGGNVSPALAWKNPPAGTKSYAITVYDPDAPTGSGWWHWVLFNIPATVTSLPAGAGNLAAGKTPPGIVQSVTDFGAPGYDGPCPPKGDRPHHYIFTVHALKVDKLDVDEKAMPALVGFMINSNRLDQATLTATYGRK